MVFISMNEHATAFFKSLKPAERRAIATRCGIKRTYLTNLISSKERHPGVALAAKIETVTNGRITRWELRPDIDWKLFEGLC